MEKPLTAAEILRRHILQRDNKPDDNMATSTPTEQQDDIDDQIRRLEAELQNDDDSVDSSEDDDPENNNPTPVANKILSLSDSRMDRIEGLPVACLPAPAPAIRKRASKRSYITDEKGAQKQKETTTTSLVSEGLRAAVQEVLSGYKPRSAERLPFYCRCCAKQYENSDSYFQHKETDFHKAAEIMERRASYCKLCRKQMTSPAQLQEHSKSRPHKDRLQQMKSRQPQNRNNNSNPQPSQLRRAEVPSRGRRHGPSSHGRF
jgi:hypothetical protein